MMNLTDKQIALIQRRRTLNRAWPWVGGFMLFGWVSYCIYMFFAHPKIANPFYMGQLLQTNSLDVSTLSVIALFTPIFFCILAGAIIAIFLILFVFMWQEHQLLKIIQQLQDSQKS